MKIKLNIDYGRRKAGQVIEVTNDKGYAMIAAGEGEATELLAYDEMTKPLHVDPVVKEKLAQPSDEEE